jgi:hypothetical protein
MNHSAFVTAVRGLKQHFIDTPPPAPGTPQHDEVVKEWTSMMGAVEQHFGYKVTSPEDISAFREKWEAQQQTPTDSTMLPPLTPVEPAAPAGAEPAETSRLHGQPPQV